MVFIKKKTIIKRGCRSDIGKFSFAHLIVNIRNSLDESIIACDSINGFKNRIDKVLHRRGLYELLIKLLSLFPSIHTEY